MNNLFKTNDMQLAAYLVIKGFPIIGHGREQGKNDSISIQVHFNKTDELSSSLVNWSSDPEVKARDFINKYKFLCYQCRKAQEYEDWVFKY